MYTHIYKTQHPAPHIIQFRDVIHHTILPPFMQKTSLCNSNTLDKNQLYVYRQTHAYYKGSSVAASSEQKTRPKKYKKKNMINFYSQLNKPREMSRPRLIDLVEIFSGQKKSFFLLNFAKLGRVKIIFNFLVWQCI